MEFPAGSYWDLVGILCDFVSCPKVLGLAESCFTSLICGLAGSMGDPRLMGAIMAGQGRPARILRCAQATSNCSIFF